MEVVLGARRLKTPHHFRRVPHLRRIPPSSKNPSSSKNPPSSPKNFPIFEEPSHHRSSRLEIVEPIPSIFGTEERRTPPHLQFSIFSPEDRGPSPPSSIFGREECVEDLMEDQGGGCDFFEDGGFSDLPAPQNEESLPSSIFEAGRLKTPFFHFFDRKNEEPLIFFFRPSPARLDQSSPGPPNYPEVWMFSPILHFEERATF